MQEKIKNYATLRRLLATGFFVSGIIPILIIAAGSIYNFKELSLKNIENTARQVVEHRNDVLNTFLQGQVNFLSTLINLYPLDYLQNKDNLMAELEKIGRIVKRVLPDAPHETLLAVDASTGQNALVQAKEFSKITPLTGLVLTKIDGTARGGVVLAIRQELDIPVKFMGFGEKIDDIGEFSSEDFMRGLLEGLV